MSSAEPQAADAATANPEPPNLGTIPAPEMPFAADVTLPIAPKAADVVIAPGPAPANEDAPQSDPAPNTIDERRRSLMPPPDEVASSEAAAKHDQVEVEKDPQSITDPSMTYEVAARSTRGSDHTIESARGRETTPEEENPKTTREPERRRAEELTLDFDALERDAPGVSPLFQNADLPPPPKNLFASRNKEPGTGKYRAVDTASDPRREPSHRPPPSRPQPTSSRSPPQSQRGIPPTPRSPSKPSGEGRYAPARPAAIFGAATKQSQPSIFSDDLVSDKSLDEVILSYLAEDLDPPHRK